MEKRLLTIVFSIMLFPVLVSAQEVGEEGPDFAVDLADGDSFKLSDHRGEVVLVFLFGNGCPYCISSAPTIESDIYQVYRDDPYFTAVGVDTWDASSTVASVKGFRNTTGVTFPLAVKAGFVASDYGTTYDRFMVIDHNGILIHKGVLPTASDMQNAIQAINQGLEAVRNDPCINGEINISYQVTSPGCPGDGDGAIDIMVSGTYPGFEYSWSTGASSEDLMNVSEGSYELTVTDNEGCMASREISVRDPEPLSIQEMVRNPDCVNDSTGTIAITPEGGTAPYQVSWSGGYTGDSLTGLTEGCYQVQVTDAHACMEQKEVCLFNKDVFPIGEISGSASVEAFDTLTYSVADMENTMFHWTVEGGILVTGQGTHQVEIEWGPDMHGMLQTIAETDDGCNSDTARLEVNIASSTTSVKNQSSGEPVLYPNPALDVLYVRSPEPVQIEIYNLAGQPLLFTREKQIDLTALEKGTYLVSIQTESFSRMERIMKY